MFDAAKRDLVRATIKEHPELSTNAIAKLTKVSHKLATDVRDGMVLPQLERHEASGRRARGRRSLPTAKQGQPLPVVYRCYAKPRLGYTELLYVGCSLELLQRLVRHDPKIPWYGEVATIRLQHYRTIKAALAAKAQAMHQVPPKYHEVRPEVRPAPLPIKVQKRRLPRKAAAVTPAQPTGVGRRSSRYPTPEDIEAYKAAVQRQAEEQRAIVGDVPSKPRIRRPRSHPAGNEA